MAYANKTYICFDADTDMNYYRLMQAWKEHETIAFNFDNAHDINNLRDGSSEETIKRKLRGRLANTKGLVVLIGENTKTLFKYVRWEIDYCIENDIPIIAVNLNGKRSMDDKRCPPILKVDLAIHVPFGQKSLDYALNNWPNQHTEQKANAVSGSHFYKDFVYKNLGL